MARQVRLLLAPRAEIDSPGTAALIQKGGTGAVPARVVSCALCGHRFVPDPSTMACARCPMNRRCAVICCPHCGYEFVTESRLVNLLRRVFVR